jgi:excisionase family DNA binding protein
MARNPDILTPEQVASMFGVDPKTVTKWAAAGKIESIRTPGGHRRYHRSQFDKFLHPETAEGR